MKREYALLAYFDEKTEQEIKQLWIKLNELTISDYGVSMQNRRPHLTLADYEDINIETLSLMLNQYFDDQVQIPIKFNGLGSFIGGNMLYLAPTLTQPLFDLHSNYHKHFKDLNQNPNSYYLPDCWVPHCTIAGRLSNETMLQAFEYCQKNFPCTHATITEIGLTEVIFNEEGIIIKEQSIISKQLTPITKEKTGS